MRLLLLAATAMLLALMAVIGGCGEKLGLPDDLPPPDRGAGRIDTTYVQLSPDWRSASGKSFNRPGDIVLGYDRYLYVCDTGNDRVVKLDLDGSFVEEYAVVHPVAITQDRGLDLLVVCGECSTRVVLPGGRDSTIWWGGSIFRHRFLHGEGFEEVFRASIPYIFLDTVPVNARFYGIAASLESDKSYYVADFWGNRILRFNSSDLAVPPALVSDGISPTTTSRPLEVYMYQIVDRQYLAFGQGIGNLGVRVLNPATGGFLLMEDDTLPPLYLFTQRGWKDIAVDEQSNFFVLVDQPDPLLGTSYYLYKYDRRGEPILRFGTEGSGERQFQRPNGLAYFDKTLYVADTFNDRITRFQLSSDIRQ